MLTFENLAKMFGKETQANILDITKSNKVSDNMGCYYDMKTAKSIIEIIINKEYSLIIRQCNKFNADITFYDKVELGAKKRIAYRDICVHTTDKLMSPSNSDALHTIRTAKQLKEYIVMITNRAYKNIESETTK